MVEPLAGYLLLAEHPHATSHHFGPSTEANRPVSELVEEVLKHWPGAWLDHSDPSQPHEADLLHLVSDKAQQEQG